MDLSALGKQPISMEKPAGADVRYTPQYEELQAEVDKLSSASAGSIDWEKVSRIAAEILMNQSKDLLVASYLSVALIHTRQNDGFSVGLKVFLELVEHFWEDLYPQKVRMRGRVRALEWWQEKTETALKQCNDVSFPPDQIRLIKENLTRLESFLMEHLENSPPLAPIKEYFDTLSFQSAESEYTKVPERAVSVTVLQGPAAAALSRQPESRQSAAWPGITSREDATKALSDGLLKISAASFYLWHQDLSGPQAYRLTRKTSWYSVNELPAATAGRTKIPPPPCEVQNLLFELRDKGDAEELLKAAEPRQPQYIFWIDLNRLVAEALDRLGSRYQGAREAVCQETAFLLHRLPGLDALSFSDGTPFASPETRDWLNGISFRALPPDASLSSSPLVAADTIGELEAEAVIEEKMTELRQLVRTGQLLEAMEVIQQKLDASSSRRENLLWRLSLSRMLVDSGKIKLALPHLEQVLDDIAGHGLERYDPGLALRGLKLAWLALQSQPEQKFKDQAQDVLHRIGRFDMPAMVRLIASQREG